MKHTLFLILLWLVACQEGSNYGKTNQNTTSNTNAFSPTNHQGNPNTTFTNNNCSDQGKWGGVTCNSSSNQDQDFLNFVSSGTDIRPNSDTVGVGDISCTPSNKGGILFRMKVTLNAPFDRNGKNDNLVMQITSSTFEIAIYDTLTGVQPIGAVFEGLNGEVNGQNANLSFIYNGNNGRKTVKLEGTFNANLFEGTIYFENEQYWDGRRPGAKGTLGKFKIATCSVFISN